VNQDNPNDRRPPRADTIYTSQRYRLMLRTAAILLLITLTISITVIIISHDDETEREATFDSTLTAVFDDVQGAATARADLVRTPQDAAPLTAHEYPFAPVDSAPIYADGASCDRQVLGGIVFDSDRTPTDALNVRVWGDYIEPRTLLTGALTGHKDGAWSVVLDGGINRRVFVQLAAAGRYLSPPVEVVFPAEDCDRMHATLDFEQVAPLD
jgi:hypothetical protein